MTRFENSYCTSGFLLHISRVGKCRYQVSKSHVHIGSTSCLGRIASSKWKPTGQKSVFYDGETVSSACFSSSFRDRSLISDSKSSQGEKSLVSTIWNTICLRFIGTPLYLSAIFHWETTFTTSFLLQPFQKGVDS